MLEKIKNLLLSTFVLYVCYKAYVFIFQYAYNVGYIKLDDPALLFVLLFAAYFALEGRK